MPLSADWCWIRQSTSGCKLGRAGEFGSLDFFLGSTSSSHLASARLP